MLTLIVNGKEHATPRVAQKVATALERWGRDCTAEAAAVRRALAKSGLTKKEG